MNVNTDRHRLLSSRALSITAKLFHNVKDAIIIHIRMNAIILYKICLASTWVLLLI
jgi:hypothetical protein